MEFFKISVEILSRAEAGYFRKGVYRIIIKLSALYKRDEIIYPAFIYKIRKVQLGCFINK